MKHDPTSKKELEELSPFLSKLKKEEGYQVPFNYFEVLPDQIMEQVASEKTAVPKTNNEARVANWSLSNWLRSFFPPRYALALASTALLLVAGVYLYNNMEVNTLGSDQLMASITAEDARNYVNSNIDDFELELLAEDLNILNGQADFFDVNQQELQEYIEDQVLDDFDTYTLEDLL